MFSCSMEDLAMGKSNLRTKAYIDNLEKSELAKIELEKKRREAALQFERALEAREKLEKAKYEQANQTKAEVRDTNFIPTLIMIRYM